jgi:HTH-type transcriptional regulator / antitoxin HigA
MAAMLGTPSRVSEILAGKKQLSMGLVQRLRARFGIPADLLLSPVRQPPRPRAARRAAA